jgi:hypothetical protein
MAFEGLANNVGDRSRRLSTECEPAEYWFMRYCPVDLNLFRVVPNCAVDRSVVSKFIIERLK